jgi:hypothetical protein
MPKLLKLLDKIHKYLVAAVIIAVPIYPKFPFIKIPFSYVSIRLEDLLIFLLAITTLILLIPWIKETFKGKIEQSIFLFVGIGALSILSAVFVTQTVQPTIGLLHWVRRIEYLIPFFAVLVSLKNNTKQKLNFYLVSVMLTVTIVLVYGLGQRLLSWPIIVTQNVELAKGIALRWIPGSHINSTFAGHYDLASYLILILPIFINLIFLVKQKALKLVLIPLVLGGLWLLAVSQSRISVVSFMLATTISMVLIKKTKWVPVFVLVALTVFASSPDLRARYMRVFQVGKAQIQKLLIVPVKPIFAQEVEGVGTRVDSIVPTPKPVEVFEDRSSSIRFAVEWPRAIRALFKNPLLGTGYSSISLATDNDYLRALGEIGFLGFASFALLLFNLGKLVVRGIRNLSAMDVLEKSIVAGFAGSFIGLLLSATFIDIFEASKLAISFWLMAGIAVFIIRNAKTGKSI